MTKAEWGDKDQSHISPGLISSLPRQCRSIAVNTGNTLDDYLKLVEQAADRGLEYVNRK